jgi:hypothetical protein
MTDRYLERLFQDSHIVEIRHQVNSRWESGLFDDLGKAQQAIWEKAHQGSLYTSLNRPYLRPVPNAFGTAPLRNEDIQTVTRLVLDFDPERPSGISSTDAEIAAACRVRDQVVTTLRAVGWPMPALGMSGNGAHAVFRACLHPDDAWRQGSALLYAGLRQQFEYLWLSGISRGDPHILWSQAHPKSR